MKILLTGATGFLGSYLLKALLKDNNEVVILKRSFSDTRRIEAELRRIASYDIDQCGLDKPFVSQSKFDAIIHTAACYGRNNESVETVFNTNTAFPVRLLELACDYEVNTFVNTDTILPKFFNVYSLSKKSLVEWGQFFSLRNQLKFINIQLEHMYGPGDDASKFTTYVLNGCMANVPELKLTQGEQRRDFIYIDDVVTAFLTLLKRADDKLMFQDYELGSGEAISVRSFVETVHRLSKSLTVLKFGALPYRDGEIMESKANINGLKALGWLPAIGIETGIQKCLQKEVPM